MLTNQTYIYYNRDSSWPIVNVFIRDSRITAKWPMLKTKLNQIQIIEAQNSMRGDFIELNVSHDKYWMKHMYDIGKRYAVIWYDGCWPTEELWNMALLETIDKWNKHEEPWAVAGHILLDRKLNKYDGREEVTTWRDTIKQYDYPHWHHQCLVMNLQSWKEIGWPDLDQDWSNNACANYKASDEHMHDNYTPHYIDGLPGLIPENQVEFVNQPGNVLIVRSLNNRYRIWNLPDELRCNKVSVYPEEGSKHLEDLLVGKKSWKEIEKHVDEDAIWLQNYVFQSYEDFIYLINTEVTNTNWYNARNDKGLIKFNNYVGVAAGWKLLHHMYHHGWEEGTEVTWYDISGPAVELKNYLINNWDGHDYEKVAIKWCEDNGYHAHNGHQIPERMNLLYDICDGYDNWIEFWQRITKECKFNFIQLDMMNDVDKILEYVPENKTTLFYASNLYSYLPNIIRCGINLEKSFVDLITGLRKKNPDNFYEGTDVADNQLFQRVTSIESARVNVATEEE
tara:strand:+ start:2054 stop:3577 length:1524 start_codon:yes stop_codon:yes gene_type:complete